nr:hypothetical protein [Tanacetum cinerariifolium]
MHVTFDELTAMASKQFSSGPELHSMTPTTSNGKKIVITESSVRRDLRQADEEGIDCLPNSTIFEQLALMGIGKGFSGRVTPLIPTMTQKLKKPTRKDTQVPQPSDPTEFIAYEAAHKELDDSLERASTTASSLEAEHDNVLDLEKTKTTKHNKIVSLKRRVKKLEKRNQSRTIDARVESSIMKKVWVRMHPNREG